MAYLSGLGDLGLWEFDEETGQFHWFAQPYEGWFTRTFGGWFQKTPSQYGYHPSQWFYRPSQQRVIQPAVQPRQRVYYSGYTRAGGFYDPEGGQ